MSHREIRRRVRPARHLCAACRERKARFQYKGHVRADHDHVLCFQCFRAERDRVRARQLKGTVPSSPESRNSRSLPLFAEVDGIEERPLTAAPRALTPKEIEHRRLMLNACEQALRDVRVASAAART